MNADKLAARLLADKYMELHFASILGVFLQWCNAPKSKRIDRIFGIQKGD